MLTVRNACKNLHAWFGLLEQDWKLFVFYCSSSVWNKLHAVEFMVDHTNLTSSQYCWNLKAPEVCDKKGFDQLV